MESNKNMTKSHVRNPVGWSIFGVGFIAFGISIIMFLPDYLHKQINHNLELHPDSRSYPEFKKPSMPLYFDVYLFNWTNPEDIYNHSVKPNFVQLGPYRFREYPDKVNVTINNENSTISYRKMSTYYFDSEGSNGSLNDTLNILNMVALGIGEKSKSWYYLQKKLMSLTLTSYGQKIYVTKNVSEILFDGYEDKLITMAKAIPLFGSDAPFDRIGFFYMKNASNYLSANYNVHTGKDDITKLGQIQNLNYLSEFPFYDGECRKFKEGSPEIFSPAPDISAPIYLFASEMCRSIPYEYETNIELHGLTGYRFSAGQRALDNGTVFEENACYSYENMPSGVMNATACSFGSPLYMSFPHFYGADPYYLNAVEGMMPDKSKHEAYMTLEQETGVTLEVVARFQSNFLIEPITDISLFEELPQILIPTFFVEQIFQIDSENATKLKFGKLLPSIVRALGLGLIILGLLMVSVSPVRKLCALRKSAINKNNKKQLSKIEPSVSREKSPLMSNTQNGYLR